MTNSTLGGAPPDHQVFHQILREYGLANLYGLGLLRLVRAIANTYEQLASEQMGDSRLSEPRWRLLVRLLVAERLGTPSVQPTHLSKTQLVSKNTISAHLRALEEDGLIVRELDPQDRRQFQIRLSSAGRALVLEATPRFVEFLNRLTSDLSVEEIEQLQTLLERLLHSVQKQGGCA